MQTRIIKRRVFWTRFFLAATILTAILIFCFSAQEGPQSAALSEGLTLAVARIIKPGFDEMPLAEKQAFMDALGFVVRKCAHFGEFALLGFNLACFLRLRLYDRGMKPAPLCALAWGIATLYAGTDELHQMFVAQRGPALTDVCIDSAGALAGVVFAAVVAMILRRSCARDTR